MSAHSSKCRKSSLRLALVACGLALATNTSALTTPAQAQNAYNAVNQAYGMASNATATGRTRLPATNMDSFVFQAGGMADSIYGDESTGLPPFMGFSQDHRINSGIFGVNDAGLTTGHGSLMPNAWGADEFLGQEWGWSGANGGNYRNIANLALDAADLLEGVLDTVIDLWDTLSASSIASDIGNDVGQAVTGSMSPGSGAGGLGGSTGF